LVQKGKVYSEALGGGKIKEREAASKTEEGEKKKRTRKENHHADPRRNDRIRAGPYGLFDTREKGRQLAVRVEEKVEKQNPGRKARNLQKPPQNLPAPKKW